MTKFTFQKAERKRVKLKIGVDGPSGSGKTMGALSIARGIIGDAGRLAVADSENESASLYADRFSFDTVSIPNAHPDTYRAIIDEAVRQAYDALVIDSLSHAWLQVLAEKEEYDRRQPKANSYTSWGIFGPKWERLMQHVLQAPIHIVATMRSKQAYEQVDQGNGKKNIVKLGLQPQVRDGAEYEFGLVFSVNIAHRAEATKDRTSLFADRMLDLCDPKLHAELRDWMNAGAPMQAPAPAPTVISSGFQPPARTASESATPTAAPSAASPDDLEFALAAARLKADFDALLREGTIDLRNDDHARAMAKRVIEIVTGVHTLGELQETVPICALLVEPHKAEVKKLWGQVRELLKRGAGAGAAA